MWRSWEGPHGCVFIISFLRSLFPFNVKLPLWSLQVILLLLLYNDLVKVSYRCFAVQLNISIDYVMFWSLSGLFMSVYGSASIVTRVNYLWLLSCLCLFHVIRLA